MRRAATILLALLGAACTASPPPPPPSAPAADEHPAVIAAPREPVAAAPLAPPGAAAPPAAAPPTALPPTAAAPIPFPPRPAAPPPPARLAPARAADLVGAWRVIALAGEGAGADSSRAAPVFVEFAADGTVAELVLESGAPPRTAAELARLLGASAPRERWTLNGEVVVVARGGGFPPESWIVERVVAAGGLDDARAEAGDVVRALVGRSGRPGARQLLRRLPGVPGA